MAYTGNAAIFCRNKFNGAKKRKNQLVNPAWIDGSTRGGAGTVLATEFAYYENWTSLNDGDERIKSHRPVTPFVGRGSGANVFEEPDLGGEPRYKYPSIAQGDILTENLLGAGLISDKGNSSLNAVGRHHSGVGGEKSGYGGTANFVFVDGHVDRMNIVDSIKKQLWGDRFYSITGNNRILLEQQ